MPSQDQDTDGRQRTAGGISLQTLLIASVASAVTSYLVSRFWGPGTIIGAAATPVLVALIAESLRKPVETVSATARKVPTVVQPRVRERDAEAAPPVDPGYVATLEAERTIRDAQVGPSGGPRWRLVLATAAAAFAIVVAAYTIPDLVTGRSITGNGKATTLFGGHRSSGGTSGSSAPKKKTTGTDPQGQGTTTGEQGTTTATTTATKTVTTTAPATTTVPAPTTTATTPSVPAPADPGTAPATPVTPTTGTTPPGTTTPATP